MKHAINVQQRMLYVLDMHVLQCAILIDPATMRAWQEGAPAGIGDSVAQSSKHKLRRAFSGFYESDLFPACSAARLLTCPCVR